MKKQFNLAAFGFALFTIYNDNTITQLVDGKQVEVKPNSKGIVQLTASANGSIGKKTFTAGEVVPVKVSDIATWPEATDWVDVPLSDEEKKAIRDKRKELQGALDKATSDMLAAFGKPEFTKLAELVNKANLELVDYDAKHPTTKAGGSKASAKKTYTPDEQKAIDAYLVLVAAEKEANDAYKKAKLAAIEGKKTLPEGYKAEKSSNSGLKAPKITDEIRAAMYHDYTVGKMAGTKLSDKYGYSPSYCNMIVKGSKTYTVAVEATKKAYEKDPKAAEKFASTYQVVLS